jgi:hypothetical protein
MLACSALRSLTVWSEISRFDRRWRGAGIPQNSPEFRNPVRHALRAIGKILYCALVLLLASFDLLPRRKKQTSEQMLNAQAVRGFKHLQHVLVLFRSAARLRHRA